MALSLTESLRGKLIRRVLTDGDVLAIETDSQRFRIRWEDNMPVLVGVDAMIVLPDVVLGSIGGYTNAS